jgi:hypothetical protein
MNIQKRGKIGKGKAEEEKETMKNEMFLFWCF